MSWFLLLAFMLGLSEASVNFTTVYEWTSLDFLWPSEEFKQEALRKRDYVPTIIIPEEHVVYGDRVFISIFKPENRPIPSTLTWLPSSESSRSPRLDPFPSWKMHERGNCDAMQRIRGLEVDVCGRLWAVDNGNEICPAKLWIFDLTENDSVSLVHQFSNDIFDHNYSNRSLKSLVLDETPNDTLAYIPDFRSRNMIVFSLKENVSWAIQIKDIHITAIALSPVKGKELVYLGLWNKPELYSVPLSELRTGRKSALTPTLVGNKTAGSLRMLMDNKGKLYFDLRRLNYIGTWDTTAPFKEEQIYKDDRITQINHQFSFAFDTCSNFWILTKDYSNTPNFRLLRAAVGVKSYLYNNDQIKGCGRTSSDYRTKNHKVTTVKATESPQTSQTVPFQASSKDNNETTVQAFSTEEPQSKKVEIKGNTINESQLNIAAICLAVITVILCCTILWLALWVKRLKIKIKENAEMAVLPSEPVVQREQSDAQMYDDVGGDSVTSISGQTELGSAIYEEVNPSPSGSELYLRVQSIGGEPHH